MNEKHEMHLNCTWVLFKIKFLIYVQKPGQSLSIFYIRLTPPNKIQWLIASSIVQSLFHFGAVFGFRPSAILKQKKKTASNLKPSNFLSKVGGQCNGARLTRRREGEMCELKLSH